MPQDRKSGLIASRWGKECARRIATKIEARMVGPKSNECSWNGERALIKCAGLKTSSVGVLYHMASKVDCVLGAFQSEDGSYKVIRLPIESCLPFMKAMPTHSRGPSAGRVGLVPRRTFFGDGRLIKVVRIDEPQISVE
jgi:hypothetical protein